MDTRSNLEHQLLRFDLVYLGTLSQKILLPFKKNENVPEFLAVVRFPREMLGKKFAGVRKKDDATRALAREKLLGPRTKRATEPSADGGAETLLFSVDDV